MGRVVEIESTAWADVVEPEDPGSQANCFGWDLKITSGETTYFARRYRDEQGVVTFHGFDRDSASAPQWRGGIPYGDADFVAAVRAVLDLPGVMQVDVFTSNETGRPERVDLSRISPH